MEDWKVFRNEQCKYNWIQIKHPRVSKNKLNVFLISYTTICNLFMQLDI